MIPEAVAAYALGLRHSSRFRWTTIVRLLRNLGFGDYDRNELEAAACAWGRAHLAPDLLAAMGSKKGPPPEAS